MPELPEIETILHGLKPHLEGAVIQDVVIRREKLRWLISPTLKRDLFQQQIITLSRRAKYLLMAVKTGTLIMHLGMSGSLRLLTGRPLHKPHDHVDIIFSNGQLLRYTDPRRFGALIWTEAPPGQHPLLQALGIEPLDSGFTSDYLKQKAMNRRVAIKQFIMNSHIVVGIGNIYAAEALFLARIHPLAPAGKLTLADCARLVEAVKYVLQSAIREGGTTIKDFINSKGNPGYFAQQLTVYGRAGLPCTQCKTPLQILKLGQRSTVFCNNCQCYS